MTNYNKRWEQVVWSSTRRACARSRFLARGLEIAGNVAAYATWQRARDLDAVPSFSTREALWTSTARALASGPVTVLEFGVADGAATRFLLDAFPNPELEWHGFDGFTGLPQPWIRGGLTHAEQGAFDAGGKPPDIDDPRVAWHVGLVEESLPGVAVDARDRLFCVFDLDLYDPTAFALEWIAPKLTPGDLLYFDEAYDPWHERRALDEFLTGGHRVRALGTTGIALMLEYRGGG